MVTRKTLSLLTGITLALFAVAGIIGNHQHGALKVIANIAWFGFLACALFLIVASIATLMRHRTGAKRT